MGLFNVGVLSTGPLIDTSGFIVCDPYYSKSAYSFDYIAEPVITVKASGDLSNVDLINKSSVCVYAAAIPYGNVGPVNTSGLVHNYSQYSDGTYTFKRIDKNNSIITSIKRGSNKTPISGNAGYDVYVGYVTSQPAGIINYGELLVASGIRTRAPYPHFSDKNPDFDVNVIDTGATVSDNTVQLFQFNFDDHPYLIDKLNEYGPGQPSLGASGFVRMTCSGAVTEVYYDSDYSLGTSPTPVFQYLMPGSGAINWRVPKYIDTRTGGYESYIFDIRYINSSGILSPSIKITYGSQELKRINEQNKIDSSNIKIPDSDTWDGPISTKIRGKTSRYRTSIGIRDIDLQSIEYTTKGTYVSNLFASEDPIYGVNFVASEQLVKIGDLKPWELIKYYISFGSSKNGDWHRISPKSRTNEIDGNGNTVPKVIILDSLNKEKFGEEKGIKFIDFNNPIYNFRIKIEMSTLKSEVRGLWSPYVYDYRVKIINREMLNSSNVEQYLWT